MLRHSGEQAARSSGLKSRFWYLRAGGVGVVVRLGEKSLRLDGVQQREREQVALAGVSGKTALEALFADAASRSVAMRLRWRTTSSSPVAVFTFPKEMLETIWSERSYCQSPICGWNWSRSACSVSGNRCGRSRRISASAKRYAASAGFSLKNPLSRSSGIARISGLRKAVLASTSDSSVLSASQAHCPSDSGRSADAGSARAWRKESGRNHFSARR